MNISNNAVNKSVLIKRAKRRLLGAFTILILIIILSYFFVKNENEAIRDNEVKISFLELPVTDKEQIMLSDEGSDVSDKFYLQAKNFLTTSKVKDEETFLSSGAPTFFIQIGIFSNIENAKKLKKKISTIGINIKEDKVVLAGKNQIKLTTDFFSSKKEAKSILLKLKESNLPGIVKEAK
jgi:hypothetical protein